MTLPPPLELAANAVTTVSIVLAARNSVHTWWTGIVGCGLFALLFFDSQLYADVTLQAFFIVTSAIGWWHWRGGVAAHALPVRRSPLPLLAGSTLAALAVTVAYGSLLHHWTDAYAPYVDSAVLAFSVVAQLLLMRRRIETWPAWLLVNTLSVPLYASRGLTLTAALYAAYWLNAWHGWWLWRRAMAKAA
jgi:nicotinamide mononucleotide transporter